MISERGRDAMPSSMVLGPDDGEAVEFGGLGVRFMVGREQSGGGFAPVEHPIAPRTLAAPMPVHPHEDEYSYVLEGEVGVQVGDEVRYARPATSCSSRAACPMPSETAPSAPRAARDHLPRWLRALLRRDRPAA